MRGQIVCTQDVMCQNAVVFTRCWPSIIKTERNSKWIWALSDQDLSGANGRVVHVDLCRLPAGSGSRSIRQYMHCPSLTTSISIANTLLKRLESLRDDSARRFGPKNLQSHNKKVLQQNIQNSGFNVTAVPDGHQIAWWIRWATSNEPLCFDAPRNPLEAASAPPQPIWRTLCGPCGVFRRFPRRQV